jgi:tetratricopeptide (TPR) repeat protein
MRSVPPRRRAACAGAFAAGLLALLGPVGVRNWIVGDTFALTTSQMGPNFYIGNHPESDGMYRPLVAGRQTPEFEGPDARRLAERALGRPLSAGEVSEYWMGRSLDFVRSQPGLWVALTVWKALLLVNAAEIPDTESFVLYLERAPWLALLARVLHFGTILALAACGIVLGWARRGDWLWLAVLAAVYGASVVAFFVMARYRYPLVPLLLPFAAHGLAEGWRRLRRGSRRALLGALAAGAVAAAVAALPLVDPGAAAIGYFNLGVAHLEAGRLDEAEAEFLRAREQGPDNVDVAIHLGVLRLRQGRPAEAEALARSLLGEHASDARVHELLSRALRRQGRVAEADRHHRIANQLNPGRELQGVPAGARRGTAPGP